MGQLYNLAKYRDDLQDLISEISLEIEINEKILLVENFQHRQVVLSQENSLYNPSIVNITQSYEQLHTVNKSCIASLVLLKDQIDNTIKQTWKELVNAPDYNDRWGTQLQQAGSLPTNTEFEELISTKIGSYCNWQYPALMFCRYPTERTIESSAGNQTFPVLRDRATAMVAGEPLYLLGDIKQLTGAIDHFPNDFQRRLRLYNFVNDDFSCIPQAQFGFVLCWDYFNYLTEELIENYLQAIIRLLRPGGSILFSYNNCEYLDSVRLAENQQATWSSEKDIIGLLEKVGFIFKKTNNHQLLNDTGNITISFIEATKPGELDTIKKHPTMGTIHQKRTFHIHQR